MYMSKEKFDEIKAKHSTTIVVDADVGEALAFVQDLLEAEADAIKNREPHATASIGRLNEAAYEGRYNVDPCSADEFPAMPQTFPRLLHLLPWDDGRYTIDPDFYAFTKLLDSFIYQCNEDATRNSPVLKALSATSRALYAFIVQNAADYNNAEWII